VTSHIPTNENGGKNSLHGGKVGYDAREWTVLSANASSVTFSLMDYGFEGFPGNVLALAQYSLSAGKLSTVLTAHALDAPTPILLTTHAYFNLGGPLVLDDTLKIRASRVVGVDGILVPTGELEYVAGGHPLDFTAAAKVAQALPDGLDNCWLFDKPGADTDQLEWVSAASGIRMRVRTNQPAIQVYSCSASDGTAVTQLGKVERFGCLAIEPQGWIDGISHPEWLQEQVYRPGGAPFVNVAEYVFDTVAPPKAAEKEKEEAARDEL
jgi:aldose 1-epimerase